MNHLILAAALLTAQAPPARVAQPVSRPSLRSDATPYQTVIVFGPPAMPSDLVLTDAGNGRDVLLEWSDNSNNETYFEIERQTMQTDGSWGPSTLFWSPANTVTCVDEAGPGEHQYRVRAVRAFQ